MDKQKSTKQRMAEYICNSSEDICKVCANNAKCNENYVEDFVPNRDECVNGIINYFEGLKHKDEQANQE